jgi:hypothetical protein
MIFLRTWFVSLFALAWLVNRHAGDWPP